MSITRQGWIFLLIGFIQWLLDCAITVLLSKAGIALEIANLIGRICGAMLGFWLNGVITFAREDVSLGHRQLWRFLPAWLLLTVVSTIAVSRVGQDFGLQAAWVIKPLVELALAGISFFISRHWIYR